MPGARDGNLCIKWRVGSGIELSLFTYLITLRQAQGERIWFFSVSKLLEMQIYVTRNG